MRRSISVLMTGLLLVACSGPGPGFTVPPITSIPPIVLPSGLPTIPPGVLPTSNPGTGSCALITPAEMGAILGGTVTAVGDEGGCTYTGAGTLGINVRTEQGDLATAKLLLDNPQDVTIGQYPAVIGSFVGVILYIQRGGTNLVIQGVLMTDDEAGRAKIIQIGTTAASRW
jgi:hypothetical protein